MAWVCLRCCTHKARRQDPSSQTARPTAKSIHLPSACETQVPRLRNYIWDVQICDHAPHSLRALGNLAQCHCLSRASDKEGWGRKETWGPGLWHRPRIGFTHHSLKHWSLRENAVFLHMRLQRALANRGFQNHQIPVEPLMRTPHTQLTDEEMGFKRKRLTKPTVELKRRPHVNTSPFTRKPILLTPPKQEWDPAHHREPIHLLGKNGTSYFTPATCQALTPRTQIHLPFDFDLLNTYPTPGTGLDLGATMEHKQSWSLLSEDSTRGDSCLSNNESEEGVSATKERHAELITGIWTNLGESQ